MQFDEDSRGFSFQKEGPLDMRMDPTLTLSAKEVVAEFSSEKLEEIFRELGEERHSRKAAKVIVEARRKQPIRTTKDLAAIIERNLPRGGGGKLHPATKIFQAIRIYVNKELESIEGSLKKAIKVLASGGKIGVISFHSLEDRIVKNIFKEASKKIRVFDSKEIKEPLLELMTKKPVIPTMKERRMNRRSRSAKLRFAMKP